MPIKSSTFPFRTPSSRHVAPSDTSVSASSRRGSAPEPLPPLVKQYERVFRDRKAADLVADYKKYMGREDYDIAKLKRRNAALEKVENDLRSNVRSMSRLDDDEASILAKRNRVLGLASRAQARADAIRDKTIDTDEGLRNLQGAQAHYSQKQLFFLDTARRYDAESFRLTQVVYQLGGAINKNSYDAALYGQRVQELMHYLRHHPSTPALQDDLRHAQQMVPYLQREDVRLRHEYSRAAYDESSAADLANRMRQSIQQLETQRSHVAGDIADLAYQTELLNSIKRQLRNDIKADLETAKYIDRELADIDYEKRDLAATGAFLRRLKNDKLDEMDDLHIKIASAQRKVDKLVQKMRDELVDHFARERARKNPREQKKPGKQSKSSGKNSANTSGNSGRRKERSQRSQEHQRQGGNGPSGTRHTYDTSGGYRGDANYNHVPVDDPVYEPEVEEPEPVVTAMPFHGQPIIMASGSRMNNGDIEAIFGRLRAGGFDDRKLREMRADMKPYLDNGEGLSAFSDKYLNVFASELGDSGITRINFAKLYAKLPAA